MKEQLLGIYVSLMVHGIAAIFLFGISKETTPLVKTVALDFSLSSVGPPGTEISEKGGESRGGVAVPKKEASSPEEDTGDSGIETPMKPASPLLSEVSETQTLIAEKRPLLEETASVEKETPLVLGKSSPVMKALLPVPEKQPPEEKKPSPALKETKPVVEGKPPPDPEKPTPVPPKKMPRKIKPKTKSAPLSGFRHSLPPSGFLAGVDQSAEPEKSSGDGLNTGPSMPAAGSGRGGKPSGIESGGGGTPRGDGGNAYLRSHFNFIRGRLREYLCYPRIARKRGWAGKVMVSFIIHPDGRADNIKIQKSCGITLLDKSALKTVQDACPFPKPPMAARIVIPILYELN